MRIAIFASCLAGALLLFGGPAAADHHEAALVEGEAEASVEGAEMSGATEIAETPIEPTEMLPLKSPSQAIAAAGAKPSPRLSDSLEAASDDAIDAWRDRRGWRYGTDSFFQLSRGLFEADVHPVVRYGALPLVAPFDVIDLPLDLFSGFYGD